jgi:hypothetical protein
LIGAGEEAIGADSWGKTNIVVHRETDRHRRVGGALRLRVKSAEIRARRVS